MFFPPAGGSTLNGVCKAGGSGLVPGLHRAGRLHADLGRATAVDLPEAETTRRKQATNPEWPILHAVLHGVTRDQFMARHKANHLNVAYAPPDATTADKALTAKAAMLHGMGIQVHLCGDIQI